MVLVHQLVIPTMKDMLFSFIMMYVLKDLALSFKLCGAFVQWTCFICALDIHVCMTFTSCQKEY
jgi:hypothetical protein